MSLLECFLTLDYALTMEQNDGTGHIFSGESRMLLKTTSFNSLGNYLSIYSRLQALWRHRLSAGKYIKKNIYSTTFIASYCKTKMKL